jgi:hypothetical protein
VKDGALMKPLIGDESSRVENGHVVLLFPRQGAAAWKAF